MKVPLRPGQTAQLIHPTEEHGAPCGAMVVAKTDDSFTITRPQEGDRPVPVDPGKLSVAMTFPSMVYVLHCEILELGDREISLRIPPDEEIQVISRRQFVRAEISVPCVLSPLEGYAESIASSIMAELVDISAGGCGVITRVPISLESTLVVTFEFPGEGTLSFQGLVKRCSPSIEGGDAFKVGILFERPDERKVISYIVAVESHRLQGSVKP